MRVRYIIKQRIEIFTRFGGGQCCHIAILLSYVITYAAQLVLSISICRTWLLTGTPAQGWTEMRFAYPAARARDGAAVFGGARAAAVRATFRRLVGSSPLLPLSS